MEPLPELALGTPVLVRNRFEGAWAPDFQIAAVESGGCWVRRTAMVPSPEHVRLG